MNDEWSRLLDAEQKLIDQVNAIRAARLALDSPPREHAYRIALRPDITTDDPLNPSTLLDDIVVNDVPMFRAEQMDRNRWWVCCYLDNTTHDRICWHVEARSKPLRIEWTGYEYPATTTYEREARGGYDV